MIKQATVIGVVGLDLALAKLLGRLAGNLSCLDHLVQVPGMRIDLGNANRDLQVDWLVLPA